MPGGTLQGTALFLSLFPCLGAVVAELETTFRRLDGPIDDIEGNRFRRIAKRRTATGAFLRFHEADMIAVAETYRRKTLRNPGEVFGAIRAAKDAWDTA